MASLIPGAFAFDLEAALRGEDPGPLEIVAQADASSVHVRPLGSGCGDEFVVALADLVPAHAPFGADLQRLGELVAARQRAGTGRTPG